MAKLFEEKNLMRSGDRRVWFSTAWAEGGRNGDGKEEEGRRFNKSTVLGNAGR